MLMVKSRLHAHVGIPSPIKVLFLVHNVIHVFFLFLCSFGLQRLMVIKMVITIRMKINLAIKFIHNINV